MNRDTLSPRRAGGVQPTTPTRAYDHGESLRGVGCLSGASGAWGSATQRGEELP
jgi:hypothetical protein